MIWQEQVLSLQRDDRTGLVFPGWWDLPGGGRKGAESPLGCALRETFEEVNLIVPAAKIKWGRPFADPSGRAVWFFVAKVEAVDPKGISLGNEGRDLAFMPIERFLTHPRVVPHFQSRLQLGLDDLRRADRA